MAEVDILYLIAPMIISITSLGATVALYMKKADADYVNSVATRFQDLQERMSHIEGRQAERDKGKGAV